MTFDAWITIAVLAVVFALLAKTRIGPDLILMAGLTALLFAGVLDPAEAFSGFSNEGIIIIGILFVVATGLQESGGIWLVVSRILGRTRSVVAAQARIMLPVAVLSGFLNNTPIVAMLLPAVSDWAKKNQLPLSKLLIPLSYASILGGMCTLVGTSTNLIVNGLLIKEGLGRLSMFEITQIGLPCAVVGIGFILLIGRKYLPDRQSLAHTLEDPREYVLEMEVERDSSLVGQTIEEADLRHLPGLYLMEIDRDGQALAAVSPDERLQAGDRLVFVGIVESIVDLQKVRGLRPATEQVFKLDSPRRERCLIEAVVSNSCPLVNKTIRAGRFRTVYNAAVIAVSRNGERIKKKIGDIILRPGDTLLLESHPSFLEQQRNSRDFFLISRIEGYTPPRHDKARLRLGFWQPWWQW